jgi:adenine specific DNA methylase Mod
MNFNDHPVTWNTDNCYYSNERQRYSTLSSVEALIEAYMSKNEPQTLRDVSLFGEVFID